MSDPLAAVINWVMKLVEGDENEPWLFGLSPMEITTYSIFLLGSVAYVLSYIFRDYFQEIPLIEMVEDVNIPGGTNEKDDCEQLVNLQNPSEPREEYCEALEELVGNGGAQSHGPCSPCLEDPDNLPGDSSSDNTWEDQSHGPCSPCLVDPDNLSGASSDESYAGEA